jgi:1-acyl-sn-glycerol-3-phosphate acyltransferase
MGVACPRKLNYMAKHDLFCCPLFSWWLGAVGAFPIKRYYADLDALKEAMRRVKEGKGLLLFPEGTRSVNGRFLAPQAGAGFLAAKLDVPVIPAFISGTEQALPRGAKMVKPTVISVRFGKQISIERRTPYQDIAEKIMENIRRLSC